MKKSAQLAWRRALRALRAECPPLLPVKVRLLPGPCPDFGWTTLSSDGAQFNIVVARKLRSGRETHECSKYELVDTLMHEWAHALTWNGLLDGDLETHTPEWGVAFARCYQAAVQD